MLPVLRSSDSEWNLHHLELLDLQVTDIETSWLLSSCEPISYNNSLSLYIFPIGFISRRLLSNITVPGQNQGEDKWNPPLYGRSVKEFAAISNPPQGL